MAMIKTKAVKCKRVSCERKTLPGRWYCSKECAPCGHYSDDRRIKAGQKRRNPSIPYANLLKRETEKEKELPARDSSLKSAHEILVNALKRQEGNTTQCERYAKLVINLPYEPFRIEKVDLDFINCISEAVEKAMSEFRKKLTE